MASGLAIAAPSGTPRTPRSALRSWAGRLLACIILSAPAAALVWFVVVPRSGRLHQQAIVDEVFSQFDRFSRRLAIVMKDGCELPEPTTVTPWAACCHYDDGFCPPSAAAWYPQKGWARMGFSIAEPTRYQFQLSRPRPDEVAISAYGDLDCDGTFSTFQQTFRVSSTDGPGCRVAPAQVIVSEDVE